MHDPVGHELQIAAGASTLASEVNSTVAPCSMRKRRNDSACFAELEAVGGQVTELRHGVQKDLLRLEHLDLVTICWVAGSRSTSAGAKMS